MTPTPLDHAYARMAADPEESAGRAAFFTAVAATDLVVPLSADPGDTAAPKPLVLETEDGPVALAFDTDLRLASFLPGPQDIAVLPGRTMAAALQGQPISVLLNAEAPSAHLLPPEALNWIASAEIPPIAILDPAAVTGVAPPGDIPGGLTGALDQALGPDTKAALVRAVDAQGRAALALGFWGGEDPEALAARLGKALAAAGLADLGLCALDLDDHPELAARIARVGSVRTRAAPAQPEPRPPTL